MARTVIKQCLIIAPFLALLSQAQEENGPIARSHWYAGEKLQSVVETENQSKAEEAPRGDGLTYKEASSGYASSRSGGLNLDQAEERGGPIYAFFTDDLRNRRANANIVTQLIFTSVGWISIYFAWPLLRGTVAGSRDDAASIFNPLLFDVGGFGDEKVVNRLGDDDLLSILDFNFTLEQVLARVATNIGWSLLNLGLWALFGKLPEADV